MRKWLMVMACVSVLLGAEKSLEELEKENKILEMQLKNQELKKKLKTNEEKVQVSDTKEENTKSEEPTKWRGKNKDEERSWAFGGIGFGIGMRSLDDRWKSGGQFSIQIGGMKMWNRRFGLQSYAEVGGVFKFPSAAYVYTTQATVGGSSTDISSLDATFNVDSIINIQNSDKFGSGFIIGLGIGAKSTSLTYAKKSGIIGNITGGKSTTTTTDKTDFQIRANIGVRAIFGHTFAMDFMVLLPFFEQKISSPVGNFRYRDISLSLRLVGGRF